MEEYNDPGTKQRRQVFSRLADPDNRTRTIGLPKHFKSDEATFAADIRRIKDETFDRIQVQQKVARHIQTKDLMLKLKREKLSEQHKELAAVPSNFDIHDLLKDFPRNRHRNNNKDKRYSVIKSKVDSQIERLPSQSSKGLDEEYPLPENAAMTPKITTGS